VDYYVEFGGGLGDVFQQIYERGHYNALLRLGRDDGCHVALICHNPHVTELFDQHPSADRLTVKLYGYWLGAEDAAQRARHGLPAAGTAAAPPSVLGPVTFYPAPDDFRTLRQLDQGKPYVVFSATAGLSERDLPPGVVRQAHAAVVAAGLLPVYVGRDYQRFGRREQPAVAGGVDLINRLGVAGVARLVQGAAGVVCCHSSVNMLAWYERRPQLLLYPPSSKARHFDRRDQWAYGADFPECVHGTFEQFGLDMTGRFLDRLGQDANVKRD
jgi:hypothetical protein